MSNEVPTSQTSYVVRPTNILGWREATRQDAVFSPPVIEGCHWETRYVLVQWWERVGEEGGEWRPVPTISATSTSP